MPASTVVYRVSVLLVSAVLNPTGGLPLGGLEPRADARIGIDLGDPAGNAGIGLSVDVLNPGMRELIDEFLLSDILRSGPEGFQNASAADCRTEKRDNEIYSRSFHDLARAENWKEETVTGGSEEPTKKTTVLSGEQFTLCWIETVTIKEDRKFKPPKRLVLREFSVSFENSATIPAEYLDCEKMISEEREGNTVDAIIEDTMESKMINLSHVNWLEDVVEWQHRNVKCAVGSVLTQSLYEWTATAQHVAMKRLEFKVSPKLEGSPVQDEKAQWTIFALPFLKEPTALPRPPSAADEASAIISETLYEQPHVPATAVVVNVEDVIPSTMEVELTSQETPTLASSKPSTVNETAAQMTTLTTIPPTTAQAKTPELPMSNKSLTDVVPEVPPATLTPVATTAPETQPADLGFGTGIELQGDSGGLVKSDVTMETQTTMPTRTSEIPSGHEPLTVAVPELSPTTLIPEKATVPETPSTDLDFGVGIELQGNLTGSTTPGLTTKTPTTAPTMTPGTSTSTESLTVIVSELPPATLIPEVTKVSEAPSIDLDVGIGAELQSDLASSATPGSTTETPTTAPTMTPEILTSTESLTVIVPELPAITQSSGEVAAPETHPPELGFGIETELLGDLGGSTKADLTTEVPQTTLTSQEPLTVAIPELSPATLIPEEEKVPETPSTDSDFEIGIELQGNLGGSTTPGLTMKTTIAPTITPGASTSTESLTVIVSELPPAILIPEVTEVPETPSIDLDFGIGTELQSDLASSATPGSTTKTPTTAPTMTPETLTSDEALTIIASESPPTTLISEVTEVPETPSIDLEFGTETELQSDSGSPATPGSTTKTSTTAPTMTPETLTSDEALTIIASELPPATLISEVTEVPETPSIDLEFGTETELQSDSGSSVTPGLTTKVPTAAPTMTPGTSTSNESLTIIVSELPPVTMISEVTKVPETPSIALDFGIGTALQSDLASSVTPGSTTKAPTAAPTMTPGSLTSTESLTVIVPELPPATVISGEVPVPETRPPDLGFGIDTELQGDLGGSAKVDLTTEVPETTSPSPEPLTVSVPELLPLTPIPDVATASETPSTGSELEIGVQLQGDSHDAGKSELTTKTPSSSTVSTLGKLRQKLNLKVKVILEQVDENEQTEDLGEMEKTYSLGEYSSATSEESISQELKLLEESLMNGPNSTVCHNLVKDTNDFITAQLLKHKDSGHPEVEGSGKRERRDVRCEERIMLHAEDIAAGLRSVVARLSENEEVASRRRTRRRRRRRRRRRNTVDEIDGWSIKRSTAAGLDCSMEFKLYRIYK